MSAVGRFQRLVIRGDTPSLEIAAALAWDAGASGCEEDPSGSALIVYAESELVSPIQSSLRAWVQESAATLEIGEAMALPDLDWSLRHRAYQHAVEISERLRVRPPWLAGGDDDIVIEARQAFGTGAHASTALALEALDGALRPAPGPDTAPRVLDLGCGSGVLAIAALRLGASGVLACDLDPQAARETLENAHANRVGGRVQVWCGGLDALRRAPVDGAVANMIRKEILPALPHLSRLLARGTWLWLSGLLERDTDEVEMALRGHGFALEARRHRDDDAERWIALGARRVDS